MSQLTTIVISLVFTFVVAVGITGFVASRVRRGSRVSARNATRPEVSFIVSARRWQGMMLRGCGILLIAVGIVCVVLAIVAPASSQGAFFPGLVIVIVGILFLRLALGLARAHLEITPESIWVFPWRGAPRQIPLSQISRLTPLTSNNYGGLVAHLEHGRSFSANRLMLGYPQLID
ncbi:MAG: hypothetical protein M3N46_10410 [Actinomycetota bacterium]|nr:hypothetical protein [Actinomycetota bacterium]